MQVISWNIGWGCKKEKIASMLKLKMEHSFCIACLQEVTPSVKKYLQSYLGEHYNYIYSLDSRYVGEFDTKSRKLGVLIIISKSFYFLYSRTLNRTPFPDRTLLVSFAYLGVEYRVINLHSVTGCNYLKAKSIQFYSFAEAIKHYQPDIVTFDANEPYIDHFDENKRVYFDNKDKGMGAKTFFNSLVNSNLTDVYSEIYNKDLYKKGEPLVTSHIINGKECRRYDFIYLSNRFDISKCEYLYSESIDASADHAMIIVDFVGDMSCRQKDSNIDFDALPFEGRVPIEELLSHCLYYKGEENPPETLSDDIGLFWEYERAWVKFSQSDRMYITQIVQDYIFAGLELFNCCNGTPTSLKALLYNRYSHWCGGYGWLNEINGFKEFYLKQYKK